MLSPDPSIFWIESRLCAPRIGEQTHAAKTMAENRDAFSFIKALRYWFITVPRRYGCLVSLIKQYPLRNHQLVNCCTAPPGSRQNVAGSARSYCDAGSEK